MPQKRLKFLTNNATCHDLGETTTWLVKNAVQIICMYCVISKPRQTTRSISATATTLTYIALWTLPRQPGRGQLRDWETVVSITASHALGILALLQTHKCHHFCGILIPPTRQTHRHSAHTNLENFLIFDVNSIGVCIMDEVDVGNVDDCSQHRNDRLALLQRSKTQNHSLSKQ